MPIIYMLTFPNGKKYIGQTKRTLKQRISAHKSVARAPCVKRRACPALVNAINCYGEDSFTAEVLIECKEDELDAFEAKMIQEHNTLAPNGYNLMTGGSTSRNYSEKAKQNMRESAAIRPNKNYKMSQETLNLPRYISKRVTKTQNGYRIMKHPNCYFKNFADSDKTPEQNLANAIAFLEKLNTGDVVVERKRDPTLPQGIYKVAHRYRVVVKIDGNTIQKSFASSSLTDEQVREQAINYLNEIKLQSPETKRSSASSTNVEIDSPEKSGGGSKATIS